MNSVGVHIGEMIRADLKSQGRSVVWFAEQLNCSSQNAFSIFKRDTPSLDICRRAGRILGKDYISILVEEAKSLAPGETGCGSTEKAL